MPSLQARLKTAPAEPAQNQQGELRARIGLSWLRPESLEKAHFLSICPLLRSVQAEPHTATNARRDLLGRPGDTDRNGVSTRTSSSSCIARGEPFENSTPLLLLGCHNLPFLHNPPPPSPRTYTCTAQLTFTLRWTAGESHEPSKPVHLHRRQISGVHFAVPNSFRT